MSQQLGLSSRREAEDLATVKGLSLVDCFSASQASVPKCSSDLKFEPQAGNQTFKPFSFQPLKGSNITLLRCHY